MLKPLRSFLTPDGRAADLAGHELAAVSRAVIAVAVVGNNVVGAVAVLVLTLLAPGFEKGQQGTLHFRYLLRAEGGFVELANDFDEHKTHLARALTGGYDAGEIRAAVERFIRPHGWQRPATPILADAITEMAPGKPSVVRRWLNSATRAGR